MFGSEEIERHLVWLNGVRLKNAKDGDSWFWLDENDKVQGHFILTKSHQTTTAGSAGKEESDEEKQRRQEDHDREALDQLGDASFARRGSVD